MVDNTIRAYRSRNLASREQARPGAGAGASDPLAELARLIGQTDPYAEDHAQQSRPAAPAAGRAAVSQREWAGERDVDPRNVDPRNYERVRPAMPSAAPLSAVVNGARRERLSQQPQPAATESYHGGQQGNDPGHEAAVQHYAAEHYAAEHYAAEHYAAEHEGGETYEAEHESGEHYLPEQEGSEAYEYEQEGGEQYPADDEYEEAPVARQPRHPLRLILVVLGLALLGSASAFAYRAKFGTTMLPMLPPIIKASNTPTKIVPPPSPAQSSTANKSAAATGGAAEHLVSREEQPVKIEPPQTTTRIVSTIPIVGGESVPPPQQAAAPPPTAPAAPAAPPAAPPQASAAATPGFASAGAPAASPWPATVPTANAGAASPWPAEPAHPAHPAPPPARASTGPKRVHTVTIRGGQTDESPAKPHTHQATHTHNNSAEQTNGPARHQDREQADHAAPLSIVPGGEGGSAGESRATRTSTTNAPTSLVASAEPTGAGSTRHHHAYSVQLSSQHSEADAKASFEALRAKFPGQLGGREPHVRRVDLGSKGVYYRAMVGPFASVEEAASWCSNLKAAGGKCLVERN
jgi:hypothetical protein